MNDGVEETPPSPPDTSSLVDEEEERDQAWPPLVYSDVFIDLAGTNIGFQKWHPVPVTAQGGRLAGQAEMGGAWEWTSSPLRKHEGFEPMALYPLYTGKSHLLPLLLLSSSIVTRSLAFNYTSKAVWEKKRR